MWPAVAGIAAIFPCLASPLAAETPTWWDDFPALVQTGDPAQAARCHATAALCGAADDPTWGTYGQRLRIMSAKHRVAQLHAAGIKALTWIEAFGTVHAYIAQFKRRPDGAWTTHAEDPEVPRPFATHWAWQQYNRTGEIRWIGIHNYFDCDDFAGPYNRLHPRYGAPPMAYPDGRPATGPADDGSDPRRRLMFDAGCAKDVLGRVAFDYGCNEKVNQIDPATGKPRGPLDGLLDTGEAPPRVPDPGFTPAEWEKLKAPHKAGIISPGKDSACPVWIDYARASVRQALDAGIDGLWVDNFSPWDSLNATPVRHAFGEWSVAGFRNHIGNNPVVAASGADPAAFDIREHLKARVREWGGDPSNLRDKAWRDPRWQDDPIWNAYLAYKREAGAAALTAFHRAIKDEAAKAGKPDFLISGNDIPMFSLGWVRGELDMVSTELSWGWGLATGPRGLMPPPLGRYAPVYRLGREHAKSRIVNAWMYVPNQQRGKPNIARVLYYEALANNAGPMPHYEGGARTAGTPDSDAAFFGFMRAAAPEFGPREPVADVGLYYSSSSQLVELLPGGFRDHADQPHMFSFWGWGTALDYLHVPWRAVPEWRLNGGTIEGLRVLILPSAAVRPSRNEMDTLRSWVRKGGRLIVAGDSGIRSHEQDGAGWAKDARRAPLHEEIPRGSWSFLRPKGSALPVPEDPGLAFYRADAKRPGLLGPFEKALADAGTPVGDSPLAAPGVPWNVGLTTHRAPGRLFVDAHNTNIDPATDTIEPTPSIRFSVALPKDLRGKRLAARVLSPDAAPTVQVLAAGAGRIEIALGSFQVYACVMIEAEPAGPK